ncbi:hypothetical protein WMF30_40260 [Sorangium sp. So ce134]
MALVLLADNRTGAVLTHHQGKGLIEPSHPQIAAKAHQKVRELIANLAALEASGWIRIERRSGRAGRIFVTGEHFCTEQCARVELQRQETHQAVAAARRRARAQRQDQGETSARGADVHAVHGSGDVEPLHGVHTTSARRAQDVCTPCMGPLHGVHTHPYDLPDLPDLPKDLPNGAFGAVACACAPACDGPGAEGGPGPETPPASTPAPPASASGGDGMATPAPAASAQPDPEPRGGPQAPQGGAIVVADDRVVPLKPPGFALAPPEPRAARAAKPGPRKAKGAQGPEPEKPPKGPTSKQRYKAAYEAGVRDAAPDQPFVLTGSFESVLGPTLTAFALDAEGKPLRGPELDAWLRARVAAFRRDTADESARYGGWEPYGFKKWLNEGGEKRQRFGQGGAPKPFLKQPWNGMPAAVVQLKPEEYEGECPL